MTDRENQAGGRTQQAKVVYPNDLDLLGSQTAATVAQGGDTDLCGYDLVGGEGQQIGSVTGLLTSRSTGRAYFAVVEISGGRSGKMQFLLPVETITVKEERAYCPFTLKQFEYGPPWRDGDSLFTYERHHAYWTGIQPSVSKEEEQARQQEPGVKASGTGLPLTNEEK